VRDGKPYAEIAHTAQSVSAFVAIDRALKAGGMAVPEIFATDLEHGFLLIEHLGSGSFLDDGRPVAERYAAAAELLAALHGRRWPDRMEAAPGLTHIVPPFDRAAMMIEADLLVDWYIPFIAAKPANDEIRSGYHDAWSQVFDRLESAERTLMLRDFHSPNLIWRGERRGHDRIGVLDFQDALIGPSAYDLASLAMDARVTVSPEIERSTYGAYVAARRAAGPFDEAGFSEAYAAMAAQRNSKILGIFVRLKERDGKPDYLRHLPRIRDYLRRALAHPALAGLKDFYRRNGLLGDTE
jgi:aminoglycoside/choline kinase family phosphotransferase